LIFAFQRTKPKLEAFLIGSKSEAKLPEARVIGRTWLARRAL